MIAALKSERFKKYGSKRRTFFVAMGILLVGGGLYVGYFFAVSPVAIRDPKLEHYHFRMQVIVNGKAENFAEQKYQTGYQKDLCNANLPEQPIHFHDNKDQIVHIHWKGMTGGMVMKYYGWDYIGGLKDALGYKLSDLANIQKVTLHGDYLPRVTDDEKFFVYVGDVGRHEEKDFNDWKNEDLEDFFGTKSRFPAQADSGGGLSRWFAALFPTASAHDGKKHPTTNEQDLIRGNNLIGNVVVFAQKNRPSDQEVKSRFEHLEPLIESTCGG